MNTISSPHISVLYAWALIATMVVAVMALAVNLQTAVWLTVFLIIGWWAWTAPTRAFLLLLILMPLLPLLKVTQTLGTGTLVKDVLIGVLMLRLVVYPLWQQQLPYRRNILLLPVILLVGWILLAAGRADELLLGVLRARDLLLYPLLYFVALYLPHRERFYREAVVWAGIVVLIVLSLAVYQGVALPDSSVLRFDPARQVWIPRLSSTLAHPSILGQYLVVWSTLLVAVTWFGQRRDRLLAAVAALLTIPFVYLTYSRAVWIGLAVGLFSMGAVAMWQRWRGNYRLPWRWLAAGTVGVVVLGTILWQTTSLGVFVRSAFDPTYASNQERLEFLARLIAPMTNADALVGRGLGDVLEQNFRSVEVTAFDVASGASRSVQVAKDQTLVDNQYLKTFVEMGLVGLLLYGWIYYLLLRRGAELVRLGANDLVRGLGVWGVGFVVAFIIQALFIDIWDIWPTNALFWIIAGLLSGHGRTLHS